MILFPAIDLFAGEAVRLYKGDYKQMTVYDDDPLRVARAFKEAGAGAIHLVDLEGAREGGTPNFDLVCRIKRETAQRLQGDFARQLRVFTQRHKVPGLRAGGFVLRQVAASLSHHPYRGDIHRQALERAQVTIVFQFGHFAVPQCVRPSL